MTSGSRTGVPQGVLTHLPEEAYRRRQVEDTVLGVFRLWGYQEVITPVFEFLDVLAAGLSEDLLQKSYKFVDRETGRLMVLRPDMTPQIARMVAGGLFQEPFPLRVCYRGTIFRHEEAHAGRGRECLQVGGELIGSSSLQADLEVILLAMACLEALGIGAFRLSLSHAGFLQGMVEVLDPAHAQEWMEVLARRDRSGIRERLEALPPGKKTGSLLRLPFLLGGEEVLEEAWRLAVEQGATAARTAVEELREVYQGICHNGQREQVLVDLGEIRDLEYYTGIFFEVFVEGLGYPVGRGGRYDTLIGRFGQSCPSTGFALEVEPLVRVMEAAHRFGPSNGSEFWIFGKGALEQVHDLARRLRAQGHPVVQDVESQSEEEALSQAKAHRIPWVLCLDPPGLGVDRLKWYDVATGAWKVESIQAFLETVQKREEAPS